MKDLILATITLLMFSLHVGADVVMWKDAKGGVHYGDNPPAQYREGARGLDLENLNTMPVNEANEKYVNKLDRDRAREKRKSVNISNYRKNKNKSKAKKSYSQMSCAEKKSAYKRSKSCFEGCRNTGGARKGWDSTQGSSGLDSFKPAGVNGQCVMRNGCTDIAQPNC